MNSMPFYLLLTSMLLNLVVLLYQFNKKGAALVVSFCGTSIVLQGLALRYIALGHMF
jgi:uncharacterized membrane protein